MLQLCRSGLICWANAPCVIGFRSVQVEAIRTGSHPSGGWLVSAFFLVVPGRRGVARRARSARRSRHGVALGPAVCPRNGTTFCALGSDRPTTVGEWTKPTSGSRASGSIYIGLSTPAVRRSTFFCRLNATQQRAERFSPRLWAERTIRRRGYQHRRARRLSTGHRAAQSRGGSEGELPASTGAISQQRSGTGSSGDQAPDTRKPAFSLVLGSLAYDRRLRSDPYDPQRPGARKRAGGEGRSTPLLHSWFVQRGDGLILRTLSPNFVLTPKLQHYHRAAVVQVGHSIPVDVQKPSTSRCRIPWTPM